MVLFGRRGAGKTHTLLELDHKIRNDGNVPIYIDMRRLGSNSEIYDDPGYPFATRASRLLIDLVEVIHESLFQLSVSDHVGDLDLAKLGPALDDLGEASTQIRVKGTIAVTRAGSTKASRSRSKGGRVRVSRTDLAMEASASSSSEQAEEDSFSLTQEGTEEFYIHLGTLENAVGRLCDALEGRSLWLLIDEWSGAIPPELQPVLADMLRRTFMRFPLITVKIMAIEHRSSFLQRTDRGNYIGLELGADTAETVSLDESLTLGDDLNKTTEFIRKLLCEHFRATANELHKPELSALSVAQIIKSSFGRQAFRMLVYASEGNPRDAMNLVSKCAREAGMGAMTYKNMLIAADAYFRNTKYKNIEGDGPLEALFLEVLQKSLHRGRRTFLVSRIDRNRPLYNRLYDQRLIHLLRSGIRSPADGSAFDGYAIDFGSYAHRMLDDTLIWTNDGWAAARTFVVDDKDPGWREGIVSR